MGRFRPAAHDRETRCRFRLRAIARIRQLDPRSDRKSDDRDGSFDVRLHRSGHILAVPAGRDNSGHAARRPASTFLSPAPRAFAAPCETKVIDGFPTIATLSSMRISRPAVPLSEQLSPVSLLRSSNRLIGQCGTILAVRPLVGVRRTMGHRHSEGRRSRPEYLDLVHYQL